MTRRVIPTIAITILAGCSHTLRPEDTSGVYPFVGVLELDWAEGQPVPRCETTIVGGMLSLGAAGYSLQLGSATCGTSPQGPLDMESRRVVGYTEGGTASRTGDRLTLSGAGPDGAARRIAAFDGRYILLAIPAGDFGLEAGAMLRFGPRLSFD